MRPGTSAHANHLGSMLRERALGDYDSSGNGLNQLQVLSRRIQSQLRLET